MYLTGENGPEFFVAPANGRFLSHNDSMRAVANVTSQHHELQIQTFDRLAGVLSRFEAKLDTMRPREIVSIGARGYIDAMDSDSELIRLQGRRQRLR
jgi:hypothetical protein